MVWDGPRFIGNVTNFIHFHGLSCALGDVGGRRIIGNALNSIHFRALGARVDPESCEMH